MLALLVALPATAQDFHKGLAAHKRGEYVTALREWRLLAEKGDAEAQYKLGFMYERGQGVLKNDREAVKWFRNAAEQGHARAQYSLGLRYLWGDGAPKNIVLAYKWWSLSSLLGHQKAGSYLDKAAKLMTPAEIAKSRKLVREWWANHKKKPPS